MIVNPDHEYTYTELMAWYDEARSRGEELILDPCNPHYPKIFHSPMVINNLDDIAALTQWLGGLKE